MLGLWSKIFWCLLRHLRSHDLIQIFYIMEIILFSYFGLKIFFFFLEGLDLIVKILWRLGFLTLVSLNPFIKGSPPTFSTHQQEKYLVYSISLLPSLVRESLRVVISNRSSEIDPILFHIVNCSVLVADPFFPALGFYINLDVFYCSCYCCFTFDYHYSS